MGYKLYSVAILVVAILAVKIYPNYPTGRIGVLFYHCKSSHQERQEFQASKEGVSSLLIDASTPVNVIIHGYTESSIRSWVVDLTNALLSRDPSSIVILVDYYDLTTISRPYMMENTRTVANITAAMIDLLAGERGVKLANIHLLGFSLGGRISGLVGNRTKMGKIGKITGIDASTPWQPQDNNDEYLDMEDASLVVTIRTSKIAYLTPPGHLNFYFNGGRQQPGCVEWYMPETVGHICDHYRAVLIMVEAVKSTSTDLFPACRCSDWESYKGNSCSCQDVNHFGLHANPSLEGNFYLTTNKESPFSQPLG